MFDGPCKCSANLTTLLTPLFLAHRGWRASKRASEKDEDTNSGVALAATNAPLTNPVTPAGDVVVVAEKTTLPNTDRGVYFTHATAPLPNTMMLHTKTSPAGNSADRHRFLCCGKLAEEAAGCRALIVGVTANRTPPPRFSKNTLSWGMGGVSRHTIELLFLS